MLKVHDIILKCESRRIYLQIIIFLSQQDFYDRKERRRLVGYKSSNIIHWRSCDGVESVKDINKTKKITESFSETNKWHFK